MFWTTSDACDLYTDSTGNSMLGCGAYFNGHWVQFQLPKNWAELDILADITCLGLVPIVLAFYIWGPNFRNKKTLLRIDNQAFVYISTREPQSQSVLWFCLESLCFSLCTTTFSLRQIILKVRIMKLLTVFHDFRNTASGVWPQMQTFYQQIYLRNS